MTTKLCTDYALERHERDTISARIRLFLLIFIIFQCSFPAFASWHIPVNNFTQKEYNAGTQNWSMSLGRNGWLYVGNSYGMLEYDGLRWQLYGISNGSAVRVVATKPDNDTIWVGGDNEYGFFAPDENGELQYTSMSSEVVDIYGYFGSIWNIIHVGGEVFFQAKNHVFVHNSNGNLRHTIQSEENIFASTLSGGKVYIVRNSGLFDITQHRISHALNGSDVLDKLDVRCLFPLADGTILIGTKEHGIYTYNNELQKLPTKAESYLCKHQLFTITANGDKLAYGTVTGGVVVEDLKSGEIYFADVNKGLQNNTVLSLLLNGDDLWCGLDIGLDLIDTHSSSRELYSRSNFLGTGYVFHRVGNEVYIGTNRALYYTRCTDVFDLDLTGCVTIPNSIGQVWGLFDFDGNLFCCHDKGLYLVRDHRLVPLSTNEGFWKIEPLAHTPHTAIAGSYTSLYVIQRTAAGYSVSPLLGLSSSCKTFAVDENDCVWITTDFGVEKITIDLAQHSVGQEMKMKRWSADSYMNIMKVDNDIYISQGNYSFSVDEDGNISDNPKILSRLLGSNVFYHSIVKDDDGNVWFSVGDALYASASASPDSVVQVWNTPRNNLYGFINVVPVGHQSAVVNTIGGFSLGNFGYARKNNHSEPPTCYIRQIVSLAPQSRKCYYSSYMSAAQPIAYADNSVRITYGSMACCSNNIEFSYALVEEGSVPSFSEWSTTAIKDYTFLSPGHYKFMLRMRTENTTIADERSIEFTILPPWWQTWWAMTIWYVSGAIFIVVLFFALHKRNERKRHRIIVQKEEEMAKQRNIHEKQILHIQNEKIENELKIKSEELSVILLSQVSRNELIDKVKHDLSKVADDITQKDTRGAIKRIAIMQNKLSSYTEEKTNWKRFEENYDEVNGLFLQKLQAKYSWISDNEKRLCVYIKMGLMNKEIAPLMNISVRGVEMIRYRMRKKMELTRDDDFESLLKTLDQ